MIRCRKVLVNELAQALGLTWHGDSDQFIDNLSTIESANEHSLVFLANARYKKFFSQTKAACILTNHIFSEFNPSISLVSANVYWLWSKAIEYLQIQPGIRVEKRMIADYVSIDPSAIIAENVHIDMGCYIGPDVCIGAHTRIGPGCYIGAGSKIGNFCRLDAAVKIYSNCSLDDRVQVQSGVVLGADGFGYTQHQGTTYKIPQLGGLTIGKNVFIGANTCIACGSIDDTIIEDNVCIDNLVQIAHNVVIGEGTMIAAQTGISGSTKIGKFCQFGGQVGVAGHLKIVDGCIFTGRAIVTHSIHTAAVYSAGTGMFESRNWRRMVAKLRRLAGN